MANYTTDGFTSEQVAQRFLNDTDWTQIPNSGLTADCVSAFGVYRNALRVIRKRANSGTSIPSSETWPTVPKEEWS
tara:strand:- start:126 stop:353 length:228 start_codon:yes stop_codon:yes gene_type:complete